MNNAPGRFRRAVTLLFLLGSLLLAAVADAEDYRTVEESTPQAVVEAMSSKMVRGITNVATGWLEVPKQIYLTSRESGGVQGAAVGPLKGIGMAVARTVVGAVDTLTFLVPLPGIYYDPMFEPAYVWQKE